MYINYRSLVIYLKVFNEVVRIDSDGLNEVLGFDERMAWITSLYTPCLQAPSHNIAFNNVKPPNLKMCSKQ
jgi:hypothetical protein